MNENVEREPNPFLVVVWMLFWVGERTTTQGTTTLIFPQLDSISIDISTQSCQRRKALCIVSFGNFVEKDENIDFFPLVLFDGDFPSKN